MNYPFKPAFTLLQYFRLNTNGYQRDVHLMCNIPLIVLIMIVMVYLISPQKSTKGSVLLDYVFTHVNLVETEYFGLRYCDRSHQTVSFSNMKDSHFIC